jgi:hypothetical protein
MSRKEFTPEEKAKIAAYKQELHQKRIDVRNDYTFIIVDLIEKESFIFADRNCSYSSESYGITLEKTGSFVRVAVKERTDYQLDGVFDEFKIITWYSENENDFPTEDGIKVWKEYSVKHPF